MANIDYDTSDHCCETGIFNKNGHAFTSINVWGMVVQCVDAYCGVWCRVLCDAYQLDWIYDQCLGAAEDGVPEENGLLEQLQKLAKYGYWNMEEKK